ncbi:MAG: AbrB/MazE/SpoVT family DNA-binding domain-containing protein [Candidatus Bathyarchaeia archaeon]|jgi:AbrB family looped-hinge helix DNA binding protein
MAEKRLVWAVKIDERGRITVPKDLLDLLGMTSKDTLAFIKEDEGPIYLGKARLQVEIPFAKKHEAESQAMQNPEKRGKTPQGETI